MYRICILRDFEQEMYPEETSLYCVLYTPPLGTLTTLHFSLVYYANAICYCYYTLQAACLAVVGESEGR